MARQDLSGFTAEQLKAHKNEQARVRMENMRKKHKEEREMAKKRSALTPTSPEVVELVDDIMNLPLRGKIELIAEWQREYKQKLPVEQVGLGPEESESYADYVKRRDKARDLMLARLYADSFFARQKAAVRKKAFDDREAAEATRLGITVFELQRRKKIAAWKAEKGAAQQAREKDRLARKVAA